MATVTLSTSFDFSAAQDWDWTVTSATASAITITNGTDTQTFAGTFTYDSAGNVSGTVTGSNFYLNGALVYTATGLNASASIVQEFALTTGDTQQTYTYMLQGNDIIKGSSGNDVLLGYGGDDTFYGNGGNDVIDGGSGNNTAVFSGKYAAATITYSAATGKFTVVTASGTDTVSNVQTFTFDDKSVASSSFVPETSAQAIAGNGSMPVSVSDSDSNVSIDLDGLQSLAAAGKLIAITLTDSGVSTLTVTAAQFSADKTALSDITSPHALTVQMSGTAAAHSFSGENWTGANALQFADQTVIVAATPGPANAVTTGNVTELYSAVLAREPDVGGLAFYQNFLKNNPSTGLQTFAEYFLNSTEYTSAHSYPQTTAGETQFINDSYQNLLHRTPSASEVSFYLTNVLEKPGTQLENHALMLVYFSASTEFLSDVQITATNSASAQHWLVLT